MPVRDSPRSAPPIDLVRKRIIAFDMLRNEIRQYGWKWGADLRFFVNQLRYLSFLHFVQLLSEILRRKLAFVQVPS